MLSTQRRPRKRTIKPRKVHRELPVNFEVEFKELEIVRESLAEAIEIVEQFKILMKCPLEETESHHSVLKASCENFKISARFKDSRERKRENFKIQRACREN
jgi:hypothetical protein